MTEESSVYCCMSSLPISGKKGKIMKKTEKSVEEVETINKKIALARLTEIVDKTEKSKISSGFISSILEDLLQFEIGFDHALLKFQAYNEYVEIEEGWMNALKRKFSRLIFVDRLIHSSGMFEFRDQIMNEVISDLMGAAVPKKEKILPVVPKPPLPPSKRRVSGG